MMRKEHLFLHEDHAEDYDKGGQVYARIRSVLASYRVPPSTFLNIKTLARVLNVSPTPVRDALIRLANEELVLQTPAGRGYFSRAASADELAAEYEAAFAIVSFSIRKNGQNFSLTGVRHPPEIDPDYVRADTDPGAICPFMLFLETLYQRLAGLSGNQKLQHYMQQFIDRTSFIREYDLLRPERLCQIMADMTRFIDLLAESRFDEALSNLEEQGRIKIGLLPELVQGLTQTAIAENKSVEVLLSEGVFKG